MPFLKSFLLAGILAFTALGGAPEIPLAKDENPPPAIVHALQLYMGAVQGTGTPFYLSCAQSISKGVYVPEVNPVVYGGVTWRGLAELNAFFGPEFMQYVGTLPKGSMIILPGGGYAIYGLELFLEHQMHVAALSAAPYYQLIQGATDYEDVSRSLQDEQTLRRNGVHHLMGARIPALNRLGELLKVPFPSTIETPAIYRKAPFGVESWQIKEGVTREEFIRSATGYVENVLGVLLRGSPYAGSFIPKDEYAQLFLPAMPNDQVDCIIDMADALTYSSDRVNLLNLYHQKLEPSRRAYLNIDLIKDYVRIKPSSVKEFEGNVVQGENGESLVLLINYLLIREPEVFRYYTTELTLSTDNKGGLKAGSVGHSNTLVMEKKQGKKLKRLVDSLKPVRYWIVNRSLNNPDVGFPLAEYEEK